MIKDWTPDVLVSLRSWCEARLYVAAAYIVTYATLDRLEPAPAFSPIDDGLIPWDGTWYRDLAALGYDHPNLEGGIRFFPLWPLLGRFFGSVGDRPDIALVVLANLFALVAGALLYRLTLQETDNVAIARRTVRLFALFPPAFVFVLGYSEALYVTLALGFVLAARSRQWLLTAALGYLAGLTRPVAGFLSLAAAVRAWETDRRSPTAALAVMSAPLGSLTFLIWAERALGDWRAPIDAQRELRGDLAEPVTRMGRAFIDGVRGDEGELFHALAGALLVVAMVVMVRRLSRDLWVYAVPSTLLLIAADNLNSMQRYALSVFPIVIAAALITRHESLQRWLPTASAVAMVCLTMLTLNGVYVP